MSRQLRETELLRADYTVENLFLHYPNTLSVSSNMNGIGILSAKIGFRWLHCERRQVLSNILK